MYDNDIESNRQSHLNFELSIEQPKCVAPLSHLARRDDPSRGGRTDLCHDPPSGGEATRRPGCPGRRVRPGHPSPAGLSLAGRP